MNEPELRAAIQNSPKRIGVVSGALTIMALLFVVHRAYVAHVNGIALWKGIMAGSFLGLVSFVTAFRLYRRERWLYWPILVTAIAIVGVSSWHGVAEIVRAVGGKRIDYIALLMTAAFALFSFVIASNLIRREAREYFDSGRTRTVGSP